MKSKTKKDLLESIKLNNFSQKDIKRMTQGLEKFRKKYLIKKTTDEIIEIIAHAFDLLKSDIKLKKELINRLNETTGFSKKMIELGFDNLVNVFSKKSIEQLINCEIGDKRYLDEWIEDSHGRFLKAFGPPLILNINAGNIPFISITPLIRSLIVKSASINKVSSKEPISLPYFATSLRKCDKKLAKCLIIAYWTSRNIKIEEPLFNIAKKIVLYGSSKTIGDVLKRTIRERTDVITHGHKVSFLVIGREFLNKKEDMKEIAVKCARDISIWDQQGCFSPHTIFVESGGRYSGMDFAKELNTAMNVVHKEIPIKDLSPGLAARINMLRNSYILKRKSKVLSGDKLSYTIIYDEEKSLEFSCLGRTIFIKPTNNVLDVGNIVKNMSDYLQTVGFAIKGKRKKTFFDCLSRVGVTRFSPVGEMSFFSVGAPHDGIFDLHKLLTWVYVEKDCYSSCNQISPMQ